MKNGWLLLLIVAGCDRPKTDIAPTPAKETAAPVVASSAPPAPAPAPAPPPPPEPAVEAKPDAKAPRAAALKAVSKHQDGKNFGLDLSSPGCKVGEDCTLGIKLSAGGSFHINKEYPYKFIATPAPQLTFLGKADPNQFTRAAGDFVEHGEKAGTMTVRFKAAAAGEAKIVGRYKLSVCNADQCQIEEEQIEIGVPVI